MTDADFGRPGGPSSAAPIEPVPVSPLRASVPDADTFFPVFANCYETRHYTSSAYEFRPAFLASKPLGMNWYAYDVEILSATSVRFVAYSIRDSFEGGIGEEVGSFYAEVDPDVTRPAIEREITRHALNIRKAELEAAEDRIIQSYADQIRASVLAQGIEARSDETAQQAQPEGQEPDPKGCAQSTPTSED